MKEQHPPEQQRASSPPSHPDTAQSTATPSTSQDHTESKPTLLQEEPTSSPPQPILEEDKQQTPVFGQVPSPPNPSLAMPAPPSPPPPPPLVPPPPPPPSVVYEEPQYASISSLTKERKIVEESIDSKPLYAELALSEGPTSSTLTDQNTVDYSEVNVIPSVHLQPDNSSEEESEEQPSTVQMEHISPSSKSSQTSPSRPPPPPVASKPSSRSSYPKLSDAPSYPPPPPPSPPLPPSPPQMTPSPPHQYTQLTNGSQNKDAWSGNVSQTALPNQVKSDNNQSARTKELSLLKRGGVPSVAQRMKVTEN